jgi:hypothetical protein
MKKLARQDRNGTRTSEELRRRYKLNEIELTIEEIEYLKQFIVVDSFLSTTSIHPVQNKVITEVLNSKVNKEEGKGLSTNDFTHTLLEKLNKISENAEENVIESISVDGIVQTIIDKNVDLQLNNNFTEDYKNQIEANTTARHTHSNQELLDTYTQTDTNLEDAVSKKHSHSNKTTLDGITADSIKRWGEIAFYESGGATDVNTTTEELALSSTNTPDSSMWYVKTMFYNSKSATSNRTQVAYGYNGHKPVMTRYYLNGTWSAWTASDIISSSITDYEGYIWYANGKLEQWGRVSITPTAANTATSVTVTFPRAYDVAPDISAIPQIATPELVSDSIGAGATNEIAKKSMVIYTTKANTSPTMYRWKAEGYKNPF